MLRQTATLLAIVVLVGAPGRGEPSSACGPASHSVLEAAGPQEGVPVEATPAGRCLAEEAARGNGMAALRLGDFYRLYGARNPGLDGFGRQIAWYRRAATLNVPVANLRLMQALDRDFTRQMPDRALTYGIVAVRAGIPGAMSAIALAYGGGRIEPGKVYYLRLWLKGQAGHDSPEAGLLAEALAAPVKGLKPV